MRSKFIAAFALLVSVSAVLVGCSDSEKKPTDFALTDAGIKTLSTRISKAEVIPQIDGTAQRVEIQLNVDPDFGGKSEWNSLAQDSHRMFTRLLEKPDVSRIFITVVSPANNNFDWARVSVTRKDLPSNWQTLTYLEFFAWTKPMPGSLQSWRWLCEFYVSYKSAQPAGGLPRNCKA